MLEKIVTAIDGLELKKGADQKGDLYEYLLSKVATSGTNGQFRTPRHIIQMMVELMKPSPSETIYKASFNHRSAEGGDGGLAVGAGGYVSCADAAGF